MIRADCRRTHIGALAAAAVVRDACFAAAETAYAICINRVRARYQNCIAASESR